MFTYTNRTLSSIALLGACVGIASAQVTNSKIGATDAGGNFIVSSIVGVPNSGFSPRIRTVKRDPYGNLLWSKDYSYSSSRDNEPVQIRVDGSGNIYVLGNSITTANKTAVFLLKYNASGVSQWTKVYSSTSMDSGRASGLALDTSGNPYYTLSYVPSLTYPAPFVGHIVKYNTAGTLQVDRPVQPQNTTTLNAIQIDSSNHVFVAGMVGTGGGYPVSGTLVSRYDTGLNNIWQTIGSVPNGSTVADMALDASGNPDVAYRVYTPADSYYYSSIVSEFDATAGTQTWSTAVATNGNDGTAGIIVDSSGNAVLGGIESHYVPATGTVNSVYRLVQFNGTTGAVNFNSSHTPAYQGSEAASLAQDLNGEYSIAGSNSDPFTGGTLVAYIPVFSSTGTSIGYWYYGPTATTYGYSIVPTSTAGTFYVGGTTYAGTGSSWQPYPLQTRTNQSGLIWMWYTTATTP